MHHDVFFYGQSSLAPLSLLAQPSRLTFIFVKVGKKLPFGAADSRKLLLGVCVSEGSDTQCDHHNSHFPASLLIPHLGACLQSTYSPPIGPKIARALKMFCESQGGIHVHVEHVE
jgi:hypothetical protein